jgi:DNA-cytosine methyltransferase
MTLNILSLFDWMSCGQIAINKLWIKDYEYYASEIDKYTISVTQHNYPNTIQLWDIKDILIVWENWEIIKCPYYDLLNVDIIMWWSPCQGFSFAWKQLNFEDPRSKLFFEYVRLVKEIKPRYFILENVKMKKEYQNVITEHLFWVEPIEINSALVSAQNRKRLYWVWELQEDWTYKQLKIQQPQDKGILLQDILEDEVDEKYNISNKHTEAMLRCRSSWKLNLPNIEWKCWAIIASYYKIPQDWPYIKCLYNPNHSNNRIYWIDWKSPTLNAMQWWNRQPKIFEENNFNIRKLTPTECQRLQTVPDNYFDWLNISNSQKYKMLGNGRTVDVIAYILSHLQLKQ